MKKLKFLLLIISSIFLFSTPVNADTILNDFSVTANDFKYNYSVPATPEWGYTDNTKVFNVFRHPGDDYYNLVMFFKNDISNYDYISFYAYNTALAYGTNNASPDTNLGASWASNLIIPLIKLNDWVCSVKPVGTTAQTQPWNYESYFWVTCEVKENRPSNNKISMEWVPSSDPTTTAGYQTTFVGFSNSDTIKNIGESVDDLNQNITNDNVNDVENTFESFEGFIAENSTITQLITMPITLYSSILNGMQSSCQPFVLGNLFGTNLTLPCINIGNYLGSSLWTMIDIIISGFAIFAISKKFIKIFNNFSSMKEGDVIND